jgi:hypothetical protein
VEEGEKMKIGMIGGKEAVFISATPDQDYHLVRFVNSTEKIMMPKHLRQTPWGHDSYRIYLPVPVIERDIKKFIPGIEFKEVVGEADAA